MIGDVAADQRKHNSAAYALPLTSGYRQRAGEKYAAVAAKMECSEQLAGPIELH
jgi:hypothetical protein